MVKKLGQMKISGQHIVIYTIVFDFMDLVAVKHGTVFINISRPELSITFVVF